MSEITADLKALAEAMIAYGRTEAASMCFKVIDHVKTIRESRDPLDVDIVYYITNAAAYNERLADQSTQIDKLQAKLDEQHELLMTYNTRNMLLKEALGEVLACRFCECEECKGTLTDALAESKRMHVKMEGPTP